jgi:hypothetical protein
MFQFGFHSADYVDIANYVSSFYQVRVKKIDFDINGNGNFTVHYEDGQGELLGDGKLVLTQADVIEIMWEEHMGCYSPS